VLGERPMADCIEKVNANFAVGLGSWLGCNRDVTHIMRDSMLYLEIIMQWSELDQYGAPTNCVC
jgi:hypothetical protein